MNTIAHPDIRHRYALAWCDTDVVMNFIAAFIGVICDDLSSHIGLNLILPLSGFLLIDFWGRKRSAGGVDPFFGLGGGGQKLEKCPKFSARSARAAKMTIVYNFV